MPTAYIDPTRLVPARLGPAAPLGLFRVLARGRDVDFFYVADHEGRRCAVAIQCAEDRWRFTTWLATDELSSWTGMSYGQLEIAVDDATAEFAEGYRLTPGTILIERSGLHLVARPENGYGIIKVSLPGATGIVSDEAASFDRWRFGWRDGAGVLQTVLEVGQA